MPRAEVGTTKWLANKMKAKGLQRLRWYCQMCEKQCRDENGFKCHRMSEGHQRQMQIFAQRPHKFMDEFSRNFESSFMRLMKTRYVRTRVLANTVYCELIADRDHVHMNSTIWVTLSEFVKYLGKTGQCKIDYTPRGWYVEYIDREKLERERIMKAKAKAETSAEERRQREIMKCVEEARAKGAYEEPEYTALERKEGETISFNLGAFSKSSSKTEAKPSTTVFESAIVENSSPSKKREREDEEKRVSDAKRRRTDEGRKKLSAMDRLAMEIEKNKKRTTPHDVIDGSSDSPSSATVRSPSKSVKANDDEEEEDEEAWLMPGLIVKVMHKKLAKGKYCGLKGQVIKIVDKYGGEVRMLDSGDVLRLDQSNLETVIPNIEGAVRIVQGEHRGKEGVVDMVDFDNFCLDVRLVASSSSSSSAKIMRSMPYESVCKVAALE